MPLCPNAKHPTELWWSPEAGQGPPGHPILMTPPHLLCATPLTYIKRFAPAAACAWWPPVPKKHPAQLPLPENKKKKGFLNICLCDIKRWPQPDSRGARQLAGGP